MAQVIPPTVGTDTITTSEFVRVNIQFTNGSAITSRVIAIGGGYRTQTIDGVGYTELGSLLSIGAQTRDLEATSGDTTVTIAGLDPQWIYFVAGGPLAAPLQLTTTVGGLPQAPIPAGYYPLIKGCELIIHRGFYGSGQVWNSAYRRFTGIITSWTIVEDRDDLIDTYTIQLNCSSYRQTLENRVANRKTNSPSWKLWNPTDTSMDRVVALEGQQFDFGKPVASGSPSDAAPAYDGGGGGV